MNENDPYCADEMFTAHKPCGCKIAKNTQTEEILFCPLHAAAPAMKDALTDLFAMIEAGELIRDIKMDADPDWTVKMMGFVARLQKAQQALLLAKGGKP